MKTTDKHAYLIIAHNDPYCFHKLISLLDDKRNDIYVHIDKKSDINLFNDVKVKYSNIYFTDRIDVRWGAYSLIQSELLLLHAAKSKMQYARYHLLSGVDLPLKSQDEIHSFFDHYQNKEFVGYTPPTVLIQQDILYKTNFFHIGLKYSRSKSFVKKAVSHIIHNSAIKMQRMLGIYTNKNINFMKGPQWFSITNTFANYILDHEEEIRKTFRYGLCVDEIFIQTLLWNSPLKSRIYNTKDDYIGCMRLIDWNRGAPWVWRNEDFETLTSSDRMFARKFSSKVDKKVINNLCNYLLGQR